MSKDVVVKGVVAKSTFDYVKETHGIGAWDRCLARLLDSDKIAVTAGGNVPIESMGRFNAAFVEEVCQGSSSIARQEFQRMGSASADALLTGGGIFSIFARFVAPKQVLARAETVIKTAYPGATVQVDLDSDEAGGVIQIHGMGGYPYGSQRIVGWLMRGIEIVGGKNAKVRETNYDAGRIDSESYELVVRWEGWS